MTTQQTSKPTPFPLGVAGNRSGIAYVSVGGRAIEAIKLESGKVLWSTEVAMVPIAINHNHLLARAIDEDRNVLAFVLLDGHSGKLILRCRPVELPRWVDTQSDSFSLS